MLALVVFGEAEIEAVSAVAVVRPPGRVVNPWTSQGMRFNAEDCRIRSFTVLRDDLVFGNLALGDLVRVATYLF